MQNEFRLALSVLLGTSILISGIWLFTGIKQYHFMVLWQSRERERERYDDYVKEKNKSDKEIAPRLGQISKRKVPI